MSSPPRSGWQLVGLVFAVLAILAGIAIVGFFAFVVIAMNQWGSNK